MVFLFGCDKSGMSASANRDSYHPPSICVFDSFDIEPLFSRLHLAISPTQFLLRSKRYQNHFIVGYFLIGLERMRECRDVIGSFEQGVKLALA
jgi:hypothetical protein